VNEAELKVAMTAARRFLKVGQAALDEHARDAWANKQSGAAKRASMDLTRALADYRGRNRDA
jgi:hypothetical protein